MFSWKKKNFLVNTISFLYDLYLWIIILYLMHLDCHYVEANSVSSDWLYGNVNVSSSSSGSSGATTSRCCKEKKNICNSFWWILPEDVL